MTYAYYILAKIADEKTQLNQSTKKIFETIEQIEVNSVLTFIHSSWHWPCAGYSPVTNKSLFRICQNAGKVKSGEYEKKKKIENTEELE